MHIGIGLWLRTTGGGESAPAEIPSGLVASISPIEGVVGTTFTINASAAGNPVPTLTYDWKIDTVSTGDTGSEYVSDTVGSLTCTVTATNSEGTSAPVTTAAVAVTAIASPYVETGYVAEDYIAA